MYTDSNRRAKAIFLLDPKTMQDYIKYNKKLSVYPSMIYRCSFSYHHSICGPFFILYWVCSMPLPAPVKFGKINHATCALLHFNSKWDIWTMLPNAIHIYSNNYELCYTSPFQTCMQAKEFGVWVKIEMTIGQVRPNTLILIFILTLSLSHP